MLIILLNLALILLHFVLVLHFAAIVITFCVSITLCGDYYILRRNKYDFKYNLLSDNKIIEATRRFHETNKHVSY